MEEATEELYQEYLKDFLPLIFQESKEKAIDKSSAYSSIYHLRNKNKGPKTCYYRAYVEQFFEYNLKDSFGNSYTDYCLIQHDGFHDGYFLVKNYDGKYNYVSIDGKLLLPKWVEAAEDFKNKRAVVKSDGKYYVIDTSGKQISDFFDRVYSYNKGVAIVETNPRFGKGYCNFIDLSGMPVINKFLPTKYFYRIKSDYCREKVNDSFDEISIGNDKYVIYKTVDLNEYKVDVKSGKYECTKGEDTFSVLYRPLRIYDNRFTLCIKDEVIYLYDRLINDYKTLGTYKDISFDGSYIFDNKNKKVSFVYEEKVIDITNYYNENLKGKTNYQINAGIQFASKNDFFIHQEEKIREQKRLDDIQKQEQKLEDSKTIEQKEMERLQKEDERKQKEIQTYSEEVLRDMVELSKKLSLIEQLGGKTEKMKFDHIYVQVGDHKEIRSDIITSGLMKIIDLSAETFENVKISSIDFRGHILTALNPQKVYNRDLSGCNFEGVYFPASKDFSGVNIKECKFTSDKKAATFDINEHNFEDAIYDETTMLNGIPLTNYLSKDKQNTNRRD